MVTAIHIQIGWIENLGCFLTPCFCQLLLSPNQRFQVTSKPYEVLSSNISGSAEVLLLLFSSCGSIYLHAIMHI